MLSELASFSSSWAKKKDLQKSASRPDKELNPLTFSKAEDSLNAILAILPKLESSRESFCNESKETETTSVASAFWARR